MFSSCVVVCVAVCVRLCVLRFTVVQFTRQANEGVPKQGLGCKSSLAHVPAAAVCFTSILVYCGTSFFLCGGGFSLIAFSITPIAQYSNMHRVAPQAVLVNTSERRRTL